MVIDKPAQVMKVIRTNLSTNGKGVEGDPIRRVIQYWTLDGELLAEVDEWEDQQKKDK